MLQQTFEPMRDVITPMQTATLVRRILPTRLTLTVRLPKAAARSIEPLAPQLEAASMLDIADEYVGLDRLDRDELDE